VKADTGSQHVSGDQDSISSDLRAFVLIGILASYNKFETQNVYQNRLEDFVNADTIRLLVSQAGHAFSRIRDEYVAVFDDYPVPWTLVSTLKMVGLKSLSSDAASPAPPTEEEAKTKFTVLPSPKAACVLSLYSFVQANKLFATQLVSAMSEKEHETSFSSFLSMTSYICHHAYRGPRQSAYATFGLLAVRSLTEDTMLVKGICSNDVRTVFRLCRQRGPHLPLITAARIPATAILDVCTDTMSHNLRKRLDVQLYSLSLGIILRIVTHLEQTKTRLQHHWAFIWGSLISLMRFLVQYAEDLQWLRNIREDLCTTLTGLAAFCLSKGDAFLPDPASFDDLFYKLIEANDTLHKFKEAYCDKGIPVAKLKSSVAALISVSSHYHDLLKAQHGKKTHQSPAVIQKVIKDGYETLNLEADEGLGQWERWRESSSKAELKRMIRVAVEDSRLLALS
jgi:hypothetical protein